MDRGSMMVKNGGKPPKLRFQPGSFARLDGQLYEIMYAFRIETNPHEWYYALEERFSLTSTPDLTAKALAALGAGATTPRVTYDLFKSSYDAHIFFFDIPINADRITVSNKEMIRRATVVSSGEVLP